MKYSLINREQFIEWLGGNLSLTKIQREFHSMDRLSPNGNILILSDLDSMSAQPAVIAVRKSDMSEFFAFVSTYVSSFKPFSAFFHVIPVEYVDLIVSQTLRYAPPSEVFQRFIGIAFAEAYAHADGKVRTLGDLSVQGVRATLSSTLMTAVSNGLQGRELALIADHWESVRSLTGQGPLALRPADILHVWDLVALARNGARDSSIIASSRQIAELIGAGLAGTVNFDDWFLPIVSTALGSDGGFKALKGSREERIKVLPSLLDILFRSKIDHELSEFIAGGFLSMVGNGSMAQLGLVDQLMRVSPRSVLWFGAISAFHTQSDALTSGACLGRKVIRDLLQHQSLFSSPNHDILFEELQVLGGKALSIEGIKPGHTGTVVVGLLGSVSGSFRMPSSKRDEEQRAQLDERIRSEQVDRDRLEELRFLLDRATRLTHDLGGSRQRDMFERAPTTPRRRK